MHQTPSLDQSRSESYRHQRPSSLTCAVVAAAISVYTIAPLVHAGNPSLEELARQSRARQEQMRLAIPSYPPSPIALPVPHIQTNKIQAHNVPGHHQSGGVVLEAKVFYNSTIDANIEAYKLGVRGGPSIEVRRPYNVLGGTRRGTVLYLSPTPQPKDNHVAVGLYGFKPAPTKKAPHSPWAIGPTIRASINGTNVQLDLTKTETSLYINRDGFAIGPLNFKNPAALKTQLHNGLFYNAGSLVLQAVAGKKARKTAQKVYGVAQLLSSPTPAALVISGFSEIRKHRKERGGWFRTIFHTVTFGAFCRK